MQATELLDDSSVRSLELLSTTKTSQLTSSGKLIAARLPSVLVRLSQRLYVQRITEISVIFQYAQTSSRVPSLLRQYAAGYAHSTKIRGADRGAMCLKKSRHGGQTRRQSVHLECDIDFFVLMRPDRLA